MEFNLPENTTLIADTARRYLKDNYSFEIYRQHIEQQNHVDASRWLAMQELGWFGLPFAESSGGFGGTLLDVAMVVRELGAALCLDPYVDMVVAPGKLLEYIGSDASLAMLSDVIDGRAKLACALYDYHAGYQVLTPSMKLNGKRLSGQKNFVPDGGFADTLLTTALADGELVVLAVPVAACETTRHRALDGGRIANMLFDEVEITDGMILARGKKAEQALSMLLAYLQALDCARMYGAAGALYQRTLEYAKTRKQFGVAIGSFQIIQHYLVDMFIDLQQLESMLLMVAVKAESEDASRRERASTAAKAYYADKAVRIAQQGIQIHGGVGVTEELDIGHYFCLVTHCSLTHGDRAHHIKRFAGLDEVHPGE
ncbi:MAG: acyl-CoA dehydrogenase family protein [Alcanivoracaceae bacterium]|jgi:alkylation response protein AidB-like acyl-CoA dehydrogenase|nr:acyl-CoA dehydrogenase family protein [Alcanivoracaceae bacterium]